MDEKYHKGFEPFFGAWKIERLIGEGNYGKVFEISRSEFGITYRAAMKAISIPQKETESDALMLDSGMSHEQVTSYYYGCVEQLSREIDLMTRLKGNSYIVSYEDHQIIPHADGIGWDIFVRMELLTPLQEYIRDHAPFTQADTVKLGIELCKALEVCGQHQIIHRDIKPENIFATETGDFKLGDFGTARITDQTKGASTRTGTNMYMAPEVFRGERYDSRVDIYSLGLVMYRLLNDGRLPFFPAYPAPITFSDRENAMVQRMNGVAFPAPKYADAKVAEIILKACAYNAENRFATPAEMRQALETMQVPSANNAPTVEKVDAPPTDEPANIVEDDEKTISRYTENVVEPDSEKASTTPVEQVETDTKKCAKWSPVKVVLLIIAGVFLIPLILIMVYLLLIVMIGYPILWMPAFVVAIGIVVARALKKKKR
mgnify:CR=1 FL=1